ncbi:MAG: DUF1028 domain-containing protein [Candidatus Eisenbacteria bacterium]|nr:DUF1028 domain-containing protein [Candidatus Eisenbacteria bacterium]
MSVETTRFWPRCCNRSTEIRERVRRRAVLCLVAAALLAAPLALASTPVATFSIVGYDPDTGDLGVAVQSRFFAVGAAVPFARSDVGAIATQAMGNMSYGPRGLDMLELGVSPEHVLETLLGSDPDSAHRQVGIVDSNGRSAAHTGSECMSWAGHRVGENYSVQGNILVSAETVDAMARAFEETDGILGERLMRAIEEGQQAGGDSRGVQSAAMLIVREGGGYGGLSDRYCDLRVDDHEDPIGELRRIFDMWKKDALIMEGYRHADEEEWDQAFASGRKAIEMSPDEGEPHYHLACYYSRAGMYEQALEELERAHELDGELPSWAAEDPDLEPLQGNERFRVLIEGE